MTDEKNTLEGDDWLDDLGGREPEAGIDELDQASIDQLLGRAGGADGGQAAVTAKEHDKAEMDGGSVEIDQASLDALLSGDDAGGGDDFFAPSSGDFGEDAASPDQSSIDALLGSDDDDFQAALEDSSNVPSQADIDELFAQAQENGEEAPVDDDVDLDELFAENSQGGSPADGEDHLGFDPADFNMNEPPALRGPAPGEDSLEEDIFDEETIIESTAAAEAKPWQKYLPLHLLTRASRRSLWGGLLAAVLLLGGGTSFVALRDPAPEAIESLPARPAPPLEAAPVVVNTLPETRGMEYRMAETGGEVPLLLAAQDQEGDALTYEVTTPPQHGRLAGELPTPVYLPNKDFPGEDLLEYRASDGKDYSEPATVLITGPDLRPEGEKEQAESRSPKLLQPRQPILQAHDITLKTLSTREVMLDWRKIWQQGNSGPFSPEVRVVITSEDLHGELTALDARTHRYRPGRQFSGSESISYRFTQGEATSKTAELRLLVEPGDFPPEIRFRAPAEKSYQVGETVILDASLTVDDDPATLSFTWRQVTGTPVKLKRLNAAGSIISFVVPSSFYIEENPGPLLQLTASDRSGQMTEKLVKIAARSRRHSPLWQGAALEGRLLDAGLRSGSSTLPPQTLIR